MNKKGFTLTELLAVITILGVLATVAIPAVMNSISKTKAASYLHTIDTVENVARLYVSDNRETISDINVAGSNIYITLQALVDKGMIKAPVMDARKNTEIPLSTTVLVHVVEKNKFYINFEYDDNTGRGDFVKPVITITGSNPASINQGQTYTDAGATALDNIDGDITSKIEVGSTVNPNIPGAYLVTYTVSDRNGNTTVATRTVNVIDVVPPTVAFNPNGNATYAKSRTSIVTVTDAGGVVDSSLKYQWTTSTTAPTEASFSSTFTSGGTINSPAGVTGGYYLWILAKDTANNMTIIKSNVFNLDNTIPDVAFGTNGNSTYAKTYSTTVTVTDTTGVNASSLEYQWTTSTSAPLEGTFSLPFTNGATINTPAGVTGGYYLWILAKDTSGNTTITDSNVFNLDNTAPTVAFGTNGSSTWQQNASTTVTVADPNSNVNTSTLKYQWTTSTSAPLEGTFSLTFTNGGTVNSTAGVTGGYYLWILAKDNLANTIITKTNVFNLDNTIPSVAYGSNGNATCAKSYSTTATVTDANAGVNASSLKYLWSTSTSTPAEGSYSSTFTSGSSVTSTAGLTGTYYLWVLAKDNAINISANTYNNHTTSTFNLDNTKPVITMTGSSPVSVNVGSVYTDAGATATDNCGPASPTVTPISTVNPNVLGAYTVTYNASDTAGNNAVTVVRTVNVVDTVDPTVAFGSNGNATYAKSRSTTATVSDNVAVNTSTLKYQWSTSASDPGNWASATGFTNGASLTSTANVTGSYYLWIQAADTSGNSATIRTSSFFNLDNTIPIITMLGSNPVTIEVKSSYTDAGATASDNIDGNITARIVPTSTVNPNSLNTYTVIYNVSDLQSNAAVPLVRTVNVVDTTDPTVAFSPNGNNIYAKSRSTTVTVSDNVAVNTSTLKYQWSTSASDPGNWASATGFTNGASLTSTANVTGSYYLWIQAADTSGNTATIKSNVFKLDNAKPVITMLGSSTVTIQVNSTYTDAGATASDGIDGDITPDIITTSGVVPTVLGTYTVTYNVSDSSTNAAVTLTRTVNVVDTVAPTIATAAAGSMLYLDPTFASGVNGTSLYDNSAGGYVTVSRVAISGAPLGSGYGLQIQTTGTATPGWGGFSFRTQTSASQVLVTRIVAKIPVGRSIQFASNSIGGGTSTWLTSQAGTGDWEEYVYQINVGTNGSYGTTNYYYLSGGSTPTAGSPLTWYVAYASVHDLGDWGTTNNVIITGSDSGTGIVGYGINQSSSTQPTYTAVSATSSFATGISNITANGTYYVWLKDAQSNVSNRAVTVSYVDRTAPTLAVSPNGNNACATSYSPTLTMSDSQSGVNTSTLEYQWTTSTTAPTEASFTTAFTNGGAVTSTADVTGNYYVWGTSEDNVTNRVIDRSDTFFGLDNTAPTVTFGTNGDSTYMQSHSTTVSVSDVGCADLSGGLAALKYQWTTSTTAPTAASFTTVFTSGATISSPASVTGSYYLWILAEDSLGNTAIVRTSAFNLDYTKPSVAISPSGNTTCAADYNPTVTVTDAHSGVNSGTLEYLWSTSTSTPAEASYVSSFTSGSAIPGAENLTGNYYLWILAKDNANNIFNDNSSTYFALDNAVPTVAFGTNGDSTPSQTNSTTVTVTDTGCAGLSGGSAALKYQWTTSTTAPIEASFSTAFTNGGTVTTPAGLNGSYYLWILAKDAVANVTIARSSAFVMDNTDPVITYFYIGGTGNPYSITSLTSTYYSSVSGATQMCFSTSSASCNGTWITYAASVATASSGQTLTGSLNTTVTRYAFYRDAALNTTAAKTDTVRYLQATHTTTYNSKASAYSYAETTSWVTGTSTVIQGSPSSGNSNYWGIMYYDLDTIRTKYTDYDISQVVYTIDNNLSGSSTKQSWLYVGGPCPTLTYTNQTTYSIAAGKPTALSAYMTSNNPGGTASAVWTITDDTWIGKLVNVNSDCLYMNRGDASYYWEGYGSKTANPPTMAITWVPR